MFFVALLHQGYQVHAGFECAHHARRRLMEHTVRHMVEQVTLELEVDDEIHFGLLANRRESPRIC